MIELAIATHTAPRDWWEEDPRTIVTAAAVLKRQAQAQAAALRGHR